ncbi:MAG TPA: DivIVA domain-containing protein [Longimicrobiales bacterium]|nr:DivIVA domain-containing protein [Longimicrobiales bacterium]
MIDLTPLDVRKKAGDFTKSLRGYDTQQVESFLELAAERFEELVKENLTLKERVDRLSEQVEAQTGREKAVNDALVTAQQLRQDISTSAQREADATRAEARADADRIRAEAEERARREVVDAEERARRAIVDAEERLADLKQSARELTRRRARFLANFRQLLERELDVVEIQEGDTLEEYMVVGLGVDPMSASEPAPESGDGASQDASSVAGADGDTSTEGGASRVADTVADAEMSFADDGAAADDMSFELDESSDSGLDEDFEESDDER